MEKVEQSLSLRSILNLMKESFDIYKRDEEFDLNKGLRLRFEEKIIYAWIILFQKEEKVREISLVEKQELKNSIVNFVQKINKISMENFENLEQKSMKRNEYFIDKSVELLMLHQTKKYFSNENDLIKLKILNFNNLSCIYKKKKTFSIALRAINYALDLQEKLLKTYSSEEKYSIIPTYLNKAAIFSQMKKHREALEMINKAKIHIQNIQIQILKQIESSTNQTQKESLTSKRFYGLYMKMIIYYNIGAENQHLSLNSEALEYYKQSKQIAIIINNQLMVEKLQGIIGSIIKKE